MLKGSIQLSCRPALGTNDINLVPVSYCASVVVAASLRLTAGNSTDVIHVTPHPKLAFNEFLATLETYGYLVPQVSYSQWRTALEKYVSRESGEHHESHALLPLFDWVTADLPSDSKSADLDDANAQVVLLADGFNPNDSEVQVDQETVGTYIAFMAEVGFIPPPPNEGKAKKLPPVRLDENQKEALQKVGRGGALQINATGLA